MKIKFILFLMIGFSSFQIQAQVENFLMGLDDDTFLTEPINFSAGDLDCAKKDDPFAQLYEVKCALKDPENPGRKACECIEDKAMNNILILSKQSEARDKMDEELESRRKMYIKRYTDVLEKMTVEAEVQKRVLGIDEGGPFVGCDPYSNAETVLEMAKNHYELKKDTLIGLMNELERKRKNRCFENGKRKHFLVGNTTCSDLDKSIAEIKSKYNIANEDQSKVNVICGGGLLLNEMDNSQTRGQTIQLNTNVFQSYTNPFQKNPSCTVSNKTETTIEKGLTSEFLGDVKAEITISPECKGHAAPKLCEGFLRSKKDFESRAQARYDHKPETQCISFSEFQVFKSAPSDELMKEFAKKEKRHKNLLSTPKNTEGVNQDRLTFLRSNPIIFKLSQDEKNRDKLNSGLHEMAKNWSRMSQPQKLKAYLDFMGTKNKEGVVSSIIKSGDGKKAEMNMCRKLAQNYTTIMTADYLSSPVKMEEGQSKLNDLDTALRACSEDKRKNERVSLEDETLKTDPVFTLGSKEPEKSREQLESEYKTFLDENCGSKPGQLSYTDHVAKNCNGIEIEVCRQNYLATTKWNLENQELQTAGVKPELSEDDWKAVAAKTDPAQQDNTYKTWWYENIGSKLSPYPTAMLGGLKQYHEAMANDAAFASSVDVPESVKSPAGSGSTNAIAQTPSASTNPVPVNSGNNQIKQFIPDFNQPQQPVFDKNKLRAGAPIEKAIPALAEKSPTEQVELLENFKQNLSQDDQDLIPKLEEAQELAQSQIPEPSEEVVKKEKDKESEVKKVAKTNAGGSAGNVGPQRTQISGANGVSIPGSMTAPRVDLTRVAKKDKTLQQLNQTLIDVNEQGDKGKNNSGAQSRGPASVNELQVSANTPAIVVEAFAKNEDLPKTDKGVLIVRDEDLVIKENYQEIVNDRQKLSAFVRSSLIGEQIGSEVVRITDSKSGLQTLLLVKPGKHGLTIKRVDRIATYTGLIYANSAAAPQTP